MEHIADFPDGRLKAFLTPHAVMRQKVILSMDGASVLGREETTNTYLRSDVIGF